MEKELNYGLTIFQLAEGLEQIETTSERAIDGARLRAMRNERLVHEVLLFRMLSTNVPLRVRYVAAEKKRYRHIGFQGFRLASKRKPLLRLSF